MWCGVLSNNLIEPHVIKGSLSAPYYCNILENKLPLDLENIVVCRPVAKR
jgi:hypothetical protein